MESTTSNGSSLKRSFLIALVLLVLVLAALALAVWTSEPDAPLPFDYDGF